MKRALLLSFFALCYTCAFCQARVDTVPKQKPKEKKVELRLMPYLSYNRNFQFMFGALPMMMYKLHTKDTVSPKSLSGLSAIYTTNGSYFVAFFNKWYLAEDKWRVKFFAFTGN